MGSNGLSLRRKTTQVQEDPADIVDKLIACILNVRRLKMTYAYIDSDIIAMDETLVWQDMLSMQLLTAQARSQLG